MLFGNLSLSMVFVFALFSAIFFLRGAKGDEKLPNIGRKLYYAFFFFTFLASAYLIYLFLAHQFQVEYVYNHSSLSEPFWYLISAFWVGQEGSFLLWLFFGSVLGIFVMSRKGKSALHSGEAGIFKSYVMFFYLLVQIFLIVLLLKRSPFSLLPDLLPDGKGLNPLLKDFWMVIHPPVVFIGYTALAVPFAYALATLVKNRYEGWTRFVLPWAGFSCLALGAGVFLGSYWAYKVLGWGVLGVGPGRERTFDSLASVHCIDARSSYGKDQRVYEKNQFPLGNPTIPINPLWHLSGSKRGFGRILGSLICRFGNKCLFNVVYDFSRFVIPGTLHLQIIPYPRHRNHQKHFIS